MFYFFPEILILCFLSQFPTLKIMVIKGTILDHPHLYASNQTLPVYLFYYFSTGKAFFQSRQRSK